MTNDKNNGPHLVLTDNNGLGPYINDKNIYYVASHLVLTNKNRYHLIELCNTLICELLE